MTDTEQTAPDEAGHPQRWIVLAVVLTAGFMNLIDVTIVNVALPRLQSGLGATSSQIEWVVAAYVLAFALGLLPFGRLGDRIGRRQMFLLGVGGFTLFSTLCGLAPSMSVLVIARIFQGFTAAMMMPQVIAIVQVIFPPRERGMAFSFFGLSAGLASVAGPLLGGLLIGADFFGLDWRPIFLVNIPFGVVALLAGRAMIPYMPGNAELRNDWGGIAIAGLAILLIIYPMIEGHSLGWPNWAFAMIVAGAACAAAFFFYERFRARNEASQLLPATLLANANFLLGVTMTMAFFSGVTGTFLLLAVFLQQGFGMTPLESGLATVPFPLGVLLASFVSGRIGRRWFKQRVAVGSLLLAGGMFFLRTVIAGVGDTVDHWRLAAPLLVCGFGMGIGISSLFQTVLSGVPQQDSGSGAGALQSFQQIGSAVGIALAGQIFFSSLSSGFAGGMPPHPTFVAAMEAALIYNIAAFLSVVVLVLFLKQPESQTYSGSPEKPRPAMAEM